MTSPEPLYRTEADHEGAWLEVAGCSEGEHSYVEAADGKGAVVQVCVDPMEIPGLTAALYQAGGHEPPVMLGRPPVDLAEGVYIGPLRAWLQGDGEVAVALGGSQSSAKPSDLRQFAAAAVVLADAAGAAQDDGEYELAAILAKHPGATFPELARAVLADGRFGRLEVRRD